MKDWRYTRLEEDICSTPCFWDMRWWVHREKWLLQAQDQPFILLHERRIHQDHNTSRERRSDRRYQTNIGYTLLTQTWWWSDECSTKKKNLVRGWGIAMCVVSLTHGRKSLRKSISLLRLCVLQRRWWPPMSITMSGWGGEKHMSISGVRRPY